MDIGVLGPLEVRSDAGDAVSVPGGKERLLLALLSAAAPEAVSVDRIMEALWNGDRPASARRSLQVHLVHLRRALERRSSPRFAGALRRQKGRELLARGGRRRGRCTPPRRPRERGRALLASGDAAEAERILAAALGLWRGEPYADWPDAPFAADRFAEPVSVSDAAVSPDLTWAGTVGQHSTVDLWDLDAQGYWKSKDGLAGHTGDVTDAAIGSDGQLLTLAPNEGESILWQVRGAAPAGPWTEGDLIRRACAVIGGWNMPPLDWARHLPGRPWRPTCSDLG
jgi:hypothetical protein